MMLHTAGAMSSDKVMPTEDAQRMTPPQLHGDLMTKASKGKKENVDVIHFYTACIILTHRRKQATLNLGWE